MARDYIKQREDVQNLRAEVEKLAKAQESVFARLTTSGDKYNELVNNARQLSNQLDSIQNILQHQWLVYLIRPLE